MEQTNLKDRISKALALSTEKIIEKAERGEILSIDEHRILEFSLAQIIFEEDRKDERYQGFMSSRLI